jgi:hypothetical protein
MQDCGRKEGKYEKEIRKIAVICEKRQVSRKWRKLGEVGERV